MPPETQVHDDVAAAALLLLHALERYLTSCGLTVKVDEADRSLTASGPVQGLLAQCVVLAKVDTGTGRRVAARFTGVEARAFPGGPPLPPSGARTEPGGPQPPPAGRSTHARARRQPILR